MFDLPLHLEFGLKFKHIGVLWKNLTGIDIVFHEKQEKIQSVNEATSSVKLNKMCSTGGLTFNLCISLNHFMVLENTETEIHFLMLGPKFKTSKAWWRKLHSKVSKAFSKSIKRRIPGILLASVKFIRSSKRRMFCPMFLPFIKPVWSERIKDGSEDSMRVDIIIEKSNWAPACYFIHFLV